MRRVGVAASSQLAADAGAQVARGGGNAVDSAVAAALVTAVTEPGLASLGGSGFVTLWPPAEDPITVEGAPEMPGRGLPPDRFRQGVVETRLAWGGGMDINVGPGTVATFGLVAALGRAVDGWGSLSWATLAAAALEHARSGFTLSHASHEFMVGTHEGVFGWNRAALAPLLDAADELKGPGEWVRFDGLVDTVAALAEEGPGALYAGEPGRLVAGHVADGGGILTLDDLRAYAPGTHPALRTRLEGWDVACCSPPSRGGAEVAAMLLLLAAEPGRMVQIQRDVMTHRQQVLDLADDLPRSVERLLRHAAQGSLPSAESSCTTHTSAVDTDSLACAITLTAGYGSGVMAPKTGFWLNNSLGELELNPRGVHGLPPGTRLASSMAPTIARSSDGAVLALGSPGSQRITTAVTQTLVNHLFRGLPLDEAVARPRLHVELEGDKCRIAHEEGAELDAGGLPTRSFPAGSMFFGGVNAAMLTAAGELELVSDPRRPGGTAVGHD